MLLWGDAIAAAATAPLESASGPTDQTANRSETEAPTAAADERQGAGRDGADEHVDEAGDEDPIAEILASELDESAIEVLTPAARQALREILLQDFALSTDPETQLRTRRERQLSRPAPGTREKLRQQQHSRQLRGGPPEDTVAVRTFDIPIVEHELVTLYVDHFSGKGRWFFEKWMARSTRYIPIMRPILREYGLPEDLVYLAMIESGYSARALSTAAASGFWQFMPSTGRLYGLRQDVWVDARRDFELATHSAARYLKMLHGMFGDWHLAFAAYNAGEGRVSRALKKTGAKTYWELIEHSSALAKETRHYVPKILAAAIIAKDPERFGFDQVEGLGKLEWDSVVASQSVELKKLADHLGTSSELLVDLNPSLVFGVTPPDASGFTVRVPRGSSEAAVAWLRTAPKADILALSTYSVRRGDTLSAIARRFGASTQVLQSYNRLSSAHRIRPGQRLVIPMRTTTKRPRPEPTEERSKVVSKEQVDPTPTNAMVPAPAPTATATATASASASASASGEGALTHHEVANGETWWSIAQKYGVTVDALKQFNGRSSNRINAGERLRLPAR